MVVAILALQGAFLEHGQMLDKLGVAHFEIRQAKDLEKHFKLVGSDLNLAKLVNYKNLSVHLKI